MSKPNFREFLEERGVLVRYLTNLSVALSKGSWPYRNGPQGPGRWLYKSFIWNETEEGHEFWNDVDRAWGDRCFGKTEVEAGIPFKDPLGVALLLEELTNDSLKEE